MLILSSNSLTSNTDITFFISFCVQLKRNRPFFLHFTDELDIVRRCITVFPIAILAVSPNDGMWDFLHNDVHLATGLMAAYKMIALLADS